MRTILLSIAVAISLATLSPSRADPGMYDDDREEYYERLQERQREDRKRYEEQVREDAKRAREAEREYRKDLREAEREYREDYPERLSRGDEQYRHSGYRGYTPLSPYPVRVAPQPGGYDAYPARPAYPYQGGRGAGLADQPFGNVENWVGYGRDNYGYGGNPQPGPGVPYGTNPDFHQDPFVPQTGGQITALADELVLQAETYLQEFLPKIGIVPESQRFLADGTVLRDSAIRLREAALRGASPAVLAAEYRNTQLSWQRLEARMARVSKGRIGPNIARNLQMGVTLEQIGQLMPH